MGISIWKYFMLMKPTEIRKTMKDALYEKYDELWKKIENIIRAKGNSSDNYDEKNIKIKLNSDDNLLLKKTLELHNIIANRSVFHEGNKYYPQVFLDEYLRKSTQQDINVGVWQNWYLRRHR